MAPSSGSSDAGSSCADVTAAAPSTASTSTKRKVDLRNHLQRTRTLDDEERRMLQHRISDGARALDEEERRTLQRSQSNRVTEIFTALGRSRNDRITRDELLGGLERLKLPASSDIVNEIFQEADANNDGYLDYSKLLGFVQQREAEIAQAFGRLTPRAHGSTAPTRDLSFADLKQALSGLGVSASDRQIAAFMTYLDQDDTGTVSLAEFTSFVYLLPRVDVAAAFESWLVTHAGGLDTGAEPGQSSGLLAEEPAGGRLRASDSAVFIAGAVSGVVSRTATAPLDRLKMLMQVSSYGRENSAVTSYRPDGVVSGLRGIYRKGGFLAFYQGNTANVIKVCPPPAHTPPAHTPLPPRKHTD